MINTQEEETVRGTTFELHSIIKESGDDNSVRLYRGTYNRNIQVDTPDGLEVRQQEAPIWMITNPGYLDNPVHSEEYVELFDLGWLRPGDEVKGFLHEGSIFFSNSAKDHTEMLAHFGLEADETNIFSLGRYAREIPFGLFVTCNHPDEVYPIGDFAGNFLIANTMFDDNSEHIVGAAYGYSLDYFFNTIVSVRMAQGEYINREFPDYRDFLESYKDQEWDNISPFLHFDRNHRAVVAWLDASGNVTVRSGSHHPFLCNTREQIKGYTEVVPERSDKKTVYQIRSTEGEIDFSDWLIKFARSLLLLGVPMDDRIRIGEETKSIRAILRGATFQK